MGRVRVLFFLRLSSLSFFFSSSPFEISIVALVSVLVDVVNQSPFRCQMSWKASSLPLFNQASDRSIQELAPSPRKKKKERKRNWLHRFSKKTRMPRKLALLIRGFDAGTLVSWLERNNDVLAVSATNFFPACDFCLLYLLSFSSFEKVHDSFAYLHFQCRLLNLQ